VKTANSLSGILFAALCRCDIFCLFSRVQVSLCRNTEAEQDKVIETVKQEIDLMAKFSHPNIVRILGATQQDCHYFVFVEWMPGL